MELEVITVASLRDALENGASVAYKKMPVDQSPDGIGCWEVRCTLIDGSSKKLVAGQRLTERTFKTVAALYNFHKGIFGDGCPLITLPVGFDEYSPEHRTREAHG